MMKKKPKDEIVKKKIKHVNAALKGIEGIYKSEKERIDRSVAHLEKERVKDHIELMNRRRNELIFMKDKFTKLKNKVATNANKIKSKINKQKQRKNKEKSHFDELYRLNEHLKGIENQVKEIDTSRKVLLGKEKKLLNETKAFFNNNKEEINLHGLKNIANIKGILDNKTKILLEAQQALSKDSKNLLADKKILERITDKQLSIIYSINNKLKKLTDDHLKLIKEKQELGPEECRFKQMLDKITEEKKQLIAQLKNV